MLFCAIVLVILSVGSLLTLVRLNNNIVAVAQNAARQNQAILEALRAIGKKESEK